MKVCIHVLAFLAMILLFAAPAAAVSTVQAVPASLALAEGETTTVDLVIDMLPDGMSGGNLTVCLSDGAVANITDVSFPSWAGIHSVGVLPADETYVKAADMGRQIESGAEDVVFATLTITGVSDGPTVVGVTVEKLDDDAGYPVEIIVLPVVQFMADVTNGTAPLTVQFTDISGGGDIIGWAWDVDSDGTVDATGKNPSWTYQNAGSYDVTLTVTNRDGSSTLTKPAFIVVTQPVSSVDIPLLAGWNMISLPLAGGEMTVPEDVMEPVYGYDPSSRSYAATSIDTLEPGKGYWISALHDCNLTVSGTPVEFWTRGLSRGWNLVGGVGEDIPLATFRATPADATGDYLYAYDTVSQQYRQTDTLSPGGAYWMLAYTNCTVNATLSSS